MKKLSLLVGGLVLSTAVMAQKPDASVPSTLEGLISWNASTLSFDAPALRYRYFLQDNIALRVTVGLDNMSTTDNYYEFGDGTGATGTWETTDNMFMFGIGGEYHFGGTDRLSPYGGLQINIGMGKYTEAGANGDNAGYVADYTEDFEAKTSMFGVDLVAGTDYYFAENFYMGLELGLGWASYTDKEAERTISSGGVTVNAIDAEAKSSFLSTGAVGTFRLGWRF